MQVMRVLPLAGRLACRLVPAGILLWAGIAKALDQQGSLLSVSSYDVLPDALVRPVATLLPWVEIAIAALLLLGFFVRFAGASTAIVTTIFVVGLIQAKARGLQIDCGCFSAGGAGDGVSWWDILRDVPIALAGVFLALRPRGPWQLDNLFEDNGTLDEMEDVDEHDHGQTHEATAAARSG
jgi:uncharacterized membrane protein YphA (DoxX/SURF4 family)